MHYLFEQSVVGRRRDTEDAFQAALQVALRVPRLEAPITCLEAH
jgi:hypothetical protein